MGLEQDIELLSRVALFEGFEREHLRLIAFGTERMTLKRGDNLYREGETSDGGYVVVEGQIDIVLVRDGHDYLLESCGPAGLIGEIALITQNVRVSSAIARERSEVLFVPRSLFHRLLREYPNMAALLHARIAQSVRQILTQLEDVEARLGGLSFRETTL